MKLTQPELTFISLLNRSPDGGKGWRKLSEVLNQHFLSVIQSRPELFEYQADPTAVRLTSKAVEILEYIL